MNKQVIKFEPTKIELVVNSAIAKNTLPKLRTEWSEWLEQFDAAELTTDSDFAAAADFVAECKKVEARLEDIKTHALSGDVQTAINALDEMQDATKRKRLEFDHAVTARKETCKSTAIDRANESLSSKLAALKHHNGGTYILRLRAAIRGKSSLTGMQAALEKESEAILNEARTYSDRFDALRAHVADLYAAAGEPVTDSELDMLVKNHYENAPERAKFILEQKRTAREQAAAPKPEPKPATQMQEAPTDAMQFEDVFPPVQHLAPPATGKVKLLRFGATFKTNNPASITASLARLGGLNIKHVEVEQ